jgi:hypothetical protein
MTLRKILEHICQQILRFEFNSASVFGLSTFFFSNKCKSFVESKILNFYSGLLGFSFFVLYLRGILAFDGCIYEISYERAKCFVFVWNLLLSSSFFVLEVKNSSQACRIYNRGIVLSSKISNGHHQDEKKFKFLMKCSLRNSILLIGLLSVKVAKFFIISSTFTNVQKIVLPFMFLPSIIFILASNRLYVTTSSCLYLMIKISEKVKETAEVCHGLKRLEIFSVFSKRLLRDASKEILALSRNESSLHHLFVDYHKVNAKSILFIIGFFFVNTVREVIKQFAVTNIAFNWIFFVI